MSGTYGDENIQNYSHGMFQSVYDYPYLSSSANHIFDITVGVSKNSALYSTVTNQKAKKRNIYNQMAQTLVGYDITGSVLRFDESGDNLNDSGNKMTDVVFLNMARILNKDEIKKGTFQLQLGLHNLKTAPFTKVVTITDKSGSDGYFVNSPAGEYGMLFATGSANSAIASAQAGSDGFTQVGLIYYQAGIIALTSSLFQQKLTTAAQIGTPTNGNENMSMALTASSIQSIADSLRRRIKNLQFNNTVELNSTVYFCRVNHHEFNYSTNPTYLSESKMRVKTKTTDNPVSYITSVGLYNDNNELLATAKLSEPLKKDPSNEFTIRVRLDY
tara:strand:- start:1994 stop:2983 length:990 start_codon:yes stop_codon:yes gene_type:complete